MSHRTLTSLLLCLLTGTAAGAGIPITGRVLGADAQPMTRAEATLEPILGSYDRARLRLEGKAGAQPVARSRPDADGIFEIAAPEAGMWKVVVSATGHLRMELRLVPLVAAEHLPVLKLRRTTELEVRLVDGAGKPRPGRVGVFAANLRGGFWRPSLRLAAAGEDGVARLPRAAEELLRLEALADGHPLVTADVGFGDDVVRLELAAGVAGSVRFTDRRRQPLARVLAYQGSGLVPFGMAGDDGRLEVVLAVKDALALRASTADLWTGAFDLDWSQEAVEGGRMESLELEPPTVLTGSVVDAGSRDPVAGALVWAVRGQAAVTDARGRYRLAHGGDLPRQLQAVAEKYRRGFGGVRPGDDGPAIALQPAVTLSGRVVDREGQPLPAVEMLVTVAPRSGFYTGGSAPWVGETSRRGTFEVHGLAAGAGLGMTFEKPGYAPKRLEVPPLEPFGLRTGLEVVLTAGRRGVGRVVDEEEVPIAAAEARLAPAAADDPMLGRIRFQHRGEDPRLHFTDADGRFEIADLGSGRYDLEVRARGFAPARVPGLRVEEGGGEIDFGTVVLVAGVELAGRVTDPEGKAIAEAEVVARNPHGPLAFSGSAEPLAKTMTDGAGRFVVGDFAPGRSLNLDVAKKGYGSAQVSSLRPPVDEPVVVVLHPAARLVGRVVDRQGWAVEDAFVHASPEPSPALAHRMRPPSRARADSDGRFVLEDVDPAPLQVMVTAPTYQAKTISGLEVAPGEEREVEVVLDPAAVIDGRVTAADGEPVLGASVHFTPRLQGNLTIVGGAGMTDADGRFHIDDAPTGAVVVRVSSHARALLEKPLELRAGANRLDLVLEDGFTVSGTVFLADGRPVGGVGLSIHEVQGPGANLVTYGTSPYHSAADGTFHIPGVSSGRYKITASLKGYAETSSDSFEVDADVTGLVLELRRGATLRGRVSGLELDELGSFSLAAYHREGGGIRHGQVDFAGRYSIDGLVPGNWHLQARVASSNRVQIVQVEIPEDLAEVVRDIEFGTGFTLAGTVLDGGEPLAGVSIVAAGSTSNTGQATTDSGGRFRIDHLPAGTYQVVVMSPGSSIQHSRSLELDGDREIRVELFTGEITGRLVDATDGSPVSAATVAVERLDAAGAEALMSRMSVDQVHSDSQGTFRVRPVHQGTWRLTATRAGYGPAEATVVVGAGATVDVEIRLTPAAEVSFEVAMASGGSPPMLQVAILDPAGRRLISGSHRVIDGRVQLDSVPAGRWELAVQGGDSAVVRVPVDAPGDPGRVVLPPGGSLNLRVPELEDELMASVELIGPDGKPFVYPISSSSALSGWVMYAGRANVSGLHPGNWSLVVRHPDGRAWSGTATVVAGATTEVTLP